MKKTLFVLLLLFTAVSAFALSAKVLDVVGKVEYQQADGNWSSVSAGSVLGPGTVLSTGFKSEAVIAVDESTITVKALTRLTIEKLYEQEGNKASSFYLDAGSLGADVKSAADKKVSFKVKTPAVTASVRGTAGNLTVSRLVGTAGTWLLSPPEPKAISYNRGDAVIAEDSAEITTAPAPVVESAGAGGAEGSEGAVSDEGDDFNWSIGNGEVTVKPGQQATFSVGQEIVTPMETAAAAATKTGGSESLSARESVASAPAATSSSAVSSVLAAVQSSLSSDLVVTPQKPAPVPTPVNPVDPVNPGGNDDKPKNGNMSIDLDWQDFKPGTKNGGMSINFKWPTITQPEETKGGISIDFKWPTIETPEDTSGNVSVDFNWPSYTPPEPTGTVVVEIDYDN